MGLHDDYGKNLLRQATGDTVDQYGPAVEINYGAGSPARIDGALGGRIAIEVESRTPKQVRGAVIDLICHPCRKKLLILLPVKKNMPNPDATAEQCRNILARFLPAVSYRVIVLEGHGNDPRLELDVKIVAEALRNLDI